MSFYLEKQNEERHSKYPFAETCHMTDMNGHELPFDFMLDVSMCTWGGSVPFLSSLSGGVGTFSNSSGVVAMFRYAGPGVYPLLDASAEHEIGCVVLGPSASGIEESKFSESSTKLCPSCFCLFSGSKPIVSFVCNSGGETVELLGNVRICGKNGIYVTKLGTDKLVIDAIGRNDPENSCCDDPLREFIIYNDDCPLISGTSIRYPDYFAYYGNDIIPGVIVLHSPLSGDTVCGRKESYIDSSGNIGFNYCDSLHNIDPPSPPDPCSDYNSSMFVAVPSNGNVDFIPFSIKAGGSPVYVKAVKAGGQASFVSNLPDPSMKNLAIAENSGTVVIGLKGSN